MSFESFSITWILVKIHIQKRRLLQNCDFNYYWTINLAFSFDLHPYLFVNFCNYQLFCNELLQNVLLQKFKYCLILQSKWHVMRRKFK